MAVRKRGARFPVAVIGPGALGLLFASRLAKVVPTAVIARSGARADALRAGVRVSKRLFKPEAFGPDELPQADWVLLLVKTYDTASALRVAKRMKPKGILSLQNGLADRVAQGVTTAAAYRDGETIVSVGTGETRIPAGFGVLGRHLRKAGFPVRVTKDMQGARLGKLLTNVCINPVTALFRIPNGELRKPPYSRLAAALAREAAPVLAAEGLRMGADEAVERVMAVARATARNRSSMLQDVRAGRRTEIDQLTGTLLRVARRHHVAVPTHTAFLHLIRIIEPR
jgi:2-dehydropantoate 2-reductase